MEIEPRQFDPLDVDHPLVGQICKRCLRAFQAGDVPTLIDPRPARPDDARKAAQGLAYNAIVDPIHWECR